MSNFFETRPGINPLKSRFLMLSLTPHFFASAFRRMTSYPAGLPFASRYISGLNCSVIQTVNVPGFMRP